MTRSIVTTSLAAAALAAGTSASSDGVPFVERALLGGSDTVVDDQFGGSVAISGDTLIVGAPDKDQGLAQDRGAAYVFVRAGAGWVQQQKLQAPTPHTNDHFGTQVAIDGDRALIASPGDDEDGLDRGACFIYDRVGSTWSFTARLEASDGFTALSLASDVALQGDRAVLGAPRAEDVNDNTGALYVFERAGNDWIEVHKLFDPNAQIHDRMGTSVALQDDTIAAGALFANGNAVNSGTAYIWRESGGTWSIEAELLAPDGGTNDFFGSDIALRDDLCVVGAYSQGSGAVYVFARTGSTWAFRQKLQHPSAGGTLDFGRSISLDDGLLVVGVPFESTPIGGGTAQLFEFGAGTFGHIGQVGNGSAPVNGFFGVAVAVDAGTVVVGSPQFNDGPGHAHVFEPVTHTVGVARCFGDGSGSACPCGNAGAVGHGCANSAAPAGAQLVADGSASVAAGDLFLSACDLVPFQPALYFQGDETINGGAGASFGDGLRCAGTNVVRLQVRVTDLGAASSTSIGIAALGNASPGETRSYQCWYRDPQASPCGSGFNLTNAVEVVFAP